MNWPVVGAVCAVFCSTWVLGWYLRGKFSDVKDAGEKRWQVLKEALDRKYDEHEVRDQKRHEDNLGEFRKVYIALTQLGWRNGIGGPK